MNRPSTKRGRRARFQALSTPPEQFWPDGLVHHGVRIGFLTALTLLTTLLFPPETRVRVDTYPVGSVREEPIIAEIAFDVPIDPVQVAAAENEARASVPPTFNRRTAAADTMGARLARFFARLDTSARQPDADAQVGRVLGEITRSTPSQRGLLLQADTRATLSRTADLAVRQILTRGVADNGDLDEVSTDRIVVRPEDGGPELTVPLDEVLPGREFYSMAEDLLPPGTSPEVAEILRLVLVNHMEYTLVFDPVETAADRAQTIGAVRSAGAEVMAGEAIVRANERITAQTALTLQAYQNALRDAGMLEEEAGVGLSPWIGAGLLNLALLTVFGLFVYFFRREHYTNVRWALLLATLLAVFIGLSGLIHHNEWPVELLPIAFVSLAISVLWDGRMALVLVLALAALMGIQPGLGSNYLLTTVLVGGSAAALSVRAVRRRAQTWIFIALISAAYATVLLGHSLLVGMPAGDMVTSLGWVAVNAIFSAILAMGFLPVFEWFTGVTTDQTLLEWADPNRSLLKRLSMEAPGTYAHTINVANLAEAAANAIEANGLLCRVGLYYHDVGKMLKPHYFVENQPDGRNPHDRLKPETSARIVKEHVVEGHRMAREAKVPEVVADFITEHHGTQRIGFFFEKAKEEYGEEAVDPVDFTYPGPRPRSKETAIAMLADSVESATRALKDPTAERIRGLIDSIVEGKISQHQLDDSPLTLHELALIKEQFAKVLTGVYHHRIDYPQTKHLTQSEAAEGEAASTDAAAAPNEAGDAAPADPEEASKGAAEGEGA
ncbi:HD family phosphohydrolase [Gaopeijia maritima]|uniref:HD family phosphohydrolase n=1 Tax=Gaopeijia maritima TaxID=3119007 RepID=UPI003269DD72